MTTEAQFLDYGTKVATVEPGGVEQIPEGERHGNPWTLLATWTSPNLEFATIFVGCLAVILGMNFWPAVTAILIGTALGSICHGVLSTWGPSSGLAQMVLGRTAFGRVGNWVPSGINALVAGIGWFAVNSVSGTLALDTLFHGPKWVWLLIVVAAQMLLAVFGHNLVQAFERYAFPVLGVIFLVGAIVIFTKAHVGTSNPSFHVPGAWWIEMSAAWGYAAGWNPYASDYTRYLPKTVSLPSVGWAAALGVFVSCAFLEIAGAAAATVNFKAGIYEPGDYAHIMTTWLGDITLVAIAVGAVAANALNIYSGAMSALATGIKISFGRARALVASIFGVVGFVLALTALHGNLANDYNDFLLVIAYWITPWVAIVFVDRYLRRGTDVTSVALSKRNRSLAGAISFVIAVAVSIWLFSNQTKYVGLVPKHHGSIGDITPIVGFVLAGVLYAVLTKLLPGRDKAAA